MADPYIDQRETIIYGKYAREQMTQVCVGMIPALDGMVHHAIAEQKKADNAMKAVLARHPTTGPALDRATVLAEARDVVVRFGSYLDSLKGQPILPSVFFQGEAPSSLARQRIVKLTAGVGHIHEQLVKHAKKVHDAKRWIAEFAEIHAKLVTLEKGRRSTRTERAQLTPDLVEARDAWLAVYNANKSLIRGLLAHANRLELMAIVFDDLSEAHRADGVVDDSPGEAPAKKAGATAAAATNGPAAGTSASTSVASNGVPPASPGNGTGAPSP